MSGTVDRVHDSDAVVPLGRSIGRTHKFLRAWVDEELAPLDSSVTEYIVLFHIDGAAAPGASQIEIARFSDMGGPALVRHIDRLEADGIVERSRDRTDRRVIRLTLTAAGRRRLADLQAVISRCDARDAGRDQRRRRGRDAADARRAVRPRPGPPVRDRRSRGHRARRNDEEDTMTVTERSAASVAAGTAAPAIETAGLTKVYPGDILAVDRLDLVGRAR